jgi:hypothetical protein
VAATAGGAHTLYPLLDAGVLTNLPAQQIASGNEKAIAGMAEKSKEEVAQAIVDGHKVSAAYVATLDEADLAKVVTLGGYEMPKAEVMAQVWIHHAIAHSYEASARWPIQ